MTDAIIVLILVMSLLLLVRSRKKNPCAGGCASCSDGSCPFSSSEEKKGAEKK